MYVYTHTYTHTRGCKGLWPPPSATTSPVGYALRRVQSQWIYAVSCKTRSTLPTGGVVAGWGGQGPLAPPARVCVYVCTYICDIFLIVLNCIKFYINLNCLPFFYLPLIYLFLRFSLRLFTFITFNATRGLLLYMVSENYVKFVKLLLFITS